MQWTEILTAIGITSLSSLTIVLVIGFVGKKILEEYFESTKEIRMLELDKELESFKDSLTNTAQERKTKYSILQIERANVIKELFSRLVSLEIKINSVISPFNPHEKGELDEVNNSFFMFSTYYKCNEIYFDDETCKLFNNIESKFLDVLKNFHIALDPDKFNFESVSIYIEVMTTEIPKLKQQLAFNFKLILGVESNIMTTQ